MSTFLSAIMCVCPCFFLLQSINKSPFVYQHMPFCLSTHLLLSIHTSASVWQHPQVHNNAGVLPFALTAAMRLRNTKNLTDIVFCLQILPDKQRCQSGVKPTSPWCYCIIYSLFRQISCICNDNISGGLVTNDILARNMNWILILINTNYDN